jgi:hypothetical protein
MLIVLQIKFLPISETSILPKQRAMDNGQWTTDSSKNFIVRFKSA